ncbi:hypothetical protein MtrunA17_Chr2g0300891 [Medicago truncatula]|uniref:Uncharacterized protein n=1 Tax=Medicago truncatula TaxID=3880 RepID=A0A396JER3_MEDTR|nr:hypothetical protein MtrunA17_Chr2g0300891 [Medicago truncatula]
MKGAKIAIFLIGDQNCNILKHRGRKVQFSLNVINNQGCQPLELSFKCLLLIYNFRLLNRLIYINSLFDKFL